MLNLRVQLRRPDFTLEVAFEQTARITGVFGPSGAAARLGIPRSTLEWKIRALKINKSRFRVPASKRS